jgi:hypothetical protein
MAIKKTHKKSRESFVAEVTNGKGYLDLKVNLNKNGKAIRISDRVGEQRVHVTLNAIADLIEALKEVQKAKIKTSVKDIAYDAAA